MAGIICFSTRCHLNAANACGCTCSFTRAVCQRSVCQRTLCSLDRLSSSALACFVQAGATCFSRQLSDQQPGKTQRLGAKNLAAKKPEKFPNDRELFDQTTGD